MQSKTESTTMKEFKSFIESRFTILIFGIFAGSMFVAIPWYLTWEEEERYKNAKYLENFIDEPEELTTRKTIRQLKPDDWNWTLKDLTEKPIQLSSLKGKVIFINSWATWCTPCVAELPSLGNLTKRYKNNNQIAFLFISNQSTTRIERMLELKPELEGLPFFKYEKEEIPIPFQSDDIPFTLIINKKGEIVITHKGSALWDSPKVISLLDKLTIQKE